MSRYPQSITATEAAALVNDGQTLCIGGGGAGHAIPDSLLKAIGERYSREKCPAGLTLLHPCGLGDSDQLGLNHLAQPGLARRVIGGFFGNAPKMVALAQTNQIEAYNFPQGVLSHLMRATAGGEKGLLTKTGLHTFVDPRLEGGKVNEKAVEDLVSKVQILGEPYLFFNTHAVDVALIRGTSLDKYGNLSMEGEVASFAMLSEAQAAKVNGGLVIAQVQAIHRDRCTPAMQVKVPGALIDYVVVEPSQPMTYLSTYDASFISKEGAIASEEQLQLSGIKRIISRRAAMELFPGAFVNLGYGLSDGVPIVARQAGVFAQLTFLIEQGPLGGIPTTGLNFGAMHQPDAILDDGYQFDFFHGGGLDLAFLGFAQVDQYGNVNASKFGGKLTGCGGFIDISQHSKKVVFCGGFAARAVVETGERGIRVKDPGTFKKFVSRVEQVTFSGSYALEKGQEILYLTERALFSLTPDGLELIEIAPGADLQTDILDAMDFRPRIASQLKTMDVGVFAATKPSLPNFSTDSTHE
jgi:propionate CoA-transferase